MVDPVEKIGPVLDVQPNGADPLEVSVALCPEQMVDNDGVILILGVSVIETVATADAVQVPTPDTTVYVVVELGVTVTFAALAGAVPVLAVQTNGPGPEDERPTLWPKQIDDDAGVTVIGTGAETVTVPLPTTVVGVPDGSKPLTVTEYTVVTPGDTVMVWVVIPPGNHAKVGLVKLVLAEIVAVCPAQIVALETGAINAQLVEPDPPI